MNLIHLFYICTGNVSVYLFKGFDPKIKLTLTKKHSFMASTTETGHAKNVATFEDLISFCTGYGATHNPSKAALKRPALTT